MSIQKRTNGYSVRWRDSSGSQRSRQVTRWRDAVALDGEMKRKKAMGELLAHERGTIRLEDFYQLWVTNYGSPHLTQRTLDVYGRLWQKHVIPALGTATRVKEISRELIAVAVSQWSISLAPSSVRKVLAVLQCVLERAVEWGYIPTNPAKGIRKPRLVQRSGRALSHDEIAALLDELPDYRSRVIVGTLVESGIRPGELRALRWVDIQGGTLVIERAASNNQIGPTKTNSRRSVLLSFRLGDVLKRWRFAHNLDAAYDLIFPGANGRLWTDSGWRMWQRQVFRPAAERAGLRGVVPYDLRHTYASNRIAAGIDILTLARQLGHSPTMTLTVYGHLLGGHNGSTADTAGDTWRATGSRE